MSVFTECELCQTVICHVLFLSVSFITISGSIVCVTGQYGLCVAVSLVTLQYQYDLFRVVPFITVQGGSIDTKAWLWF